MKAPSINSPAAAMGGDSRKEDIEPSALPAGDEEEEEVATAAAAVAAASDVDDATPAAVVEIWAAVFPTKEPS